VPAAITIGAVLVVSVKPVAVPVSHTVSAVETLVLPPNVQVPDPISTDLVFELLELNTMAVTF
jgi:hypothetical protein